MPKLTTGWKAACAAVFLTLSAGFTPVFAQEEPQEVLTEEEDSLEVVETAIPWYSPDIPDELIMDRMKCIENEFKLTFNSQVKSFIDYFSVKNRRYLTVMERRRNVYFPIFEEYLKKHNMPDELKYLSIVESGLNPTAKSRVGAAGLWQFMPATGKIYNLDQDFYIDERLDPHKSTEAACKYLKQLYNMFDDWELALASYNCGPGNVRKAIRRSGYKDTFWEIYNYLPRETRGYVPQFIAVTYVMNYLDEYKFEKDSLEYAMSFDTIRITETVNLNTLSECLNVCMEDIQKLNPGLKREIVPSYLNYSLKVPSDVMDTFNSNRVAILDCCVVSRQERLAFENQAQPAKTYYTVRRGDYLGKIASRNNVSISNLRKWNNLRGNTVYVGQRLVVYSKEVTSSTFSEFIASREDDQVTVASVDVKQDKVDNKKPDKIYHTVRYGDNLHDIAVRYGVSINDLREWNGIRGSVIHSGQKLAIYGKSSRLNRDIQKIYYVQPGDTLWSISKKYNGISIDDIKRKNNLKSENIKPGMKLIIG